MALISLPFWSPTYSLEKADIFGGDYLQEYVGGWIVRHGDRERFYDLSYAKTLQHDPKLVGFEFKNPNKYFPIIYPPFHYLFASPLTRLTYRQAVFVWYGLMQLALLLSLALLWRTDREGFEAFHPWTVALLFFYWPLLENAAGNQKGTLVLLALVGTWALLRRQRPFEAGLVFAFVAFKPQLTLVIAFAWLFARQWRFIAGGFLMGGALVACCFIVGKTACKQYFEISLNMGDYIQTSGFPLTRMHCFYGFFELLLGNVAPKWLVKALTLLACCGCVAALVAVFRRTRQDFQESKNAALDLRFSALCIATVLMSPHLLTYDMSLLILPMFLCFRSHKNMVLLVFFAAALSENVAAVVPVQLTVIALSVWLWQLAWGLSYHDQ